MLHSFGSLVQLEKDLRLAAAPAKDDGSRPKRTIAARGQVTELMIRLEFTARGADRIRTDE